MQRGQMKTDDLKPDSACKKDSMRQKRKRKKELLIELFRLAARNPVYLLERNYKNYVSSSLFLI